MLALSQDSNMGSKDEALARLVMLVEKLTLEVGRLNRRVRILELARDARERVESDEHAG